MERRKKYTISGIIYAFTIIIILMSQMVYAAFLNLSWNGNTESDLDGYKVYYGTDPGVYEEPVDVGDVTEYQLSGLSEGVTYYLAITAYDTSGNYRDTSIQTYTVEDEVTWTPPPPTDTTTTDTSDTDPTDPTPTGSGFDEPMIMALGIGGVAVVIIVLIVMRKRGGGSGSFDP